MGCIKSIGLTLSAVRFIDLCAQILCPTVYCDLGIAHMRDAGFQDAATGTPAYDRGELLAGNRIDDFTVKEAPPRPNPVIFV